MTSKERTLKALAHESPDKTPVDFGATPVTGIHVLAVEGLRKHFGFEDRPIRVIEPYQMLGEIDNELMEAMGIDIIGLSPRNNMFGINNTGELKEFETFWGQKVLIPKDFNTSFDEEGNLLIHPEGDLSVAPSGKMPKASYFFDAVIRQEPIDEVMLDPEDNLEEFNPISDEDLKYWEEEIKKIDHSNKAVIANFGGTAFGDIALVPGLNLKNPKGIRDVAEWYMSVIMRPDYIHEIFSKQSDIALSNLEKIFKIVGNKVDVAFLCGTDFGTQDSQFCGVDTLEEMYIPYYKKVNDWIHKNTNWKTFKHSCGAVEPFIDSFIEAGFDILNPVQINATGMDPQHLKDTYGDRITFWGGGIDTQKVLSFGTTQDVEKQVEENLKIFGKNGGYVFNTVHNIQANVPVENIIAMLKAIERVNS
jgi:uroporphyrinogen-III decarboxylase